MNDQAKQYQQLIAKCWADEAFKNRLVANPMVVLKEEGIETPPGVDVSVHEDTESQMFIVIPNRPEELSDEDLESTAGGFGTGTLV